MDKKKQTYDKHCERINSILNTHPRRIAWIGIIVYLFVIFTIALILYTLWHRVF